MYMNVVYLILIATNLLLVFSVGNAVYNRHQSEKQLAEIINEMKSDLEGMGQL